MYMVFHDWKRNGNKDIVGDFIKFQIYKYTTSNKNYFPCSGTGISTFREIIETAGCGARNYY